jgi:hypothetical protein
MLQSTSAAFHYRPDLAAALSDDPDYDVPLGTG